MRQIEISHEVPISLLDVSKSINDYDYCLVHLLDQYEEYKNFYMNNVKEGRKVLLDNSLFELETLFDGDIFAEKILELRPTEYIIPDSLENIDETINSYNNFVSKYSDLPGIKIGVVQGKNYRELVECYKFMSDKADKIAISFDYSYYRNCFSELDKLNAWCLGRQKFISDLVEDGFWNYNKPHHLLGCSLSKEFLNKKYNNLNIESVDTSNPIVAAIKNLKYNDIYGLEEKPSVKLCDLITTKLNTDQLQLTNYNTRMFRKACNG